MGTANAYDALDYVDLFARHIHKLTAHPNGELRGLCPLHEDKNPSWTGNRQTGLWRCFGCEAHGNAAQFAKRVGEAMPAGERTIVATYPYCDEHGALLFEVVRFLPKGFAQRRPNGNGGWTWNLAGVRRVLYRLPEIIPQPLVCIVEGEKDADRLWSLGISATTCPGGAGKWRYEYSQTLAGKRVVILPDNDLPGEEHAVKVARALLPVAAGVQLIRLPGLPPKGDPFDWLDSGHTKEELLALFKTSPLLRLEDLTQPKEAKAPRVTLRHPSALVASPISWRVEGILPDGMLTVLHARDKVGKTLFAWEIARAMLNQQALLGTFAVTPGRVVLALLDDPHALTVQRRDALELADCEDLRIVTPLDADLSDPMGFLADFQKACEEFKPHLIVTDALYLFAPTGRDSMNDAARMRGPMGVFNSLAEALGAAVLLIAHDRNDGSDVAGSHVIRANAKTLLHLTKPKWGGEEEEDDGRRILTVVSKMTAEARHLLRNQGVGAWSYIGRGDSARQARTTWAQDRVQAWLKEGGKGTAEEIAKAVKIRKEDALFALTALIEEGTATSEVQPRTDGKKGKGRLVYSLAKAAEKPDGPAPGTDSPKEADGNDRAGSQKPASNGAQSDIPNVPPLENRAGTIGQAQKPTIDRLFSADQTYRSQGPLSREDDNEEGEL